jgi:hypothetical protein
MTYAFGTLELTDQAIEAAQAGDVKAIASILTVEITALKDDFKADLNRILHGAGAGVLCQTNGTGANSTGLTVASAPSGGDATQYLCAGQYIQFGTGSTALISSVDSATGVTLASGATWSNAVVITKAYDAEAMGLAGIIDDGDNAATIQALTRSTTPYSKAHVYDTSTTLTEANMIATYLKTTRYGGAKAILMNSGLFAYYGSLLTTMKRAQMTEVLSGGWKGLEFMGGKLGVLLDFDTWSGYVQMVDFDALSLAEMSAPFAWLEADAHGGILKRSSSNRTIWEGTLKYYFNLIALKFLSSARMSGQTPAP